MDYSRKKTWGWVHTFLTPLPSDVLGVLGPKTKTPGDYTFLITSENSTFFLINPRKFLLLFLQYPWEFHILYPPFCFFSGIAQWRNVLITHYRFKIIWFAINKINNNFWQEQLRKWKSSYETFLVLSSSTRFMYFVRNILYGFVELAVK